MRPAKPPPTGMRTPCSTSSSIPSAARATSSFVASSSSRIAQVSTSRICRVRSSSAPSSSSSRRCASAASVTDCNRRTCSEVEASGHTPGPIPEKGGSYALARSACLRTSSAAASASPAATSASETARYRIGSTEARRATGSRQSAAAVTSAPAIARRVRPCWPNQPKSGPVTTPPSSTRCSLTKKPRVFANEYWAPSAGLSVMRKYPRSAAAVQASPSSAARRGSRWVEPTTKASTSHGADSRLTSVGQPMPQTWPDPRYWSPAPKAAESSSATATVSFGLTPTAVDQLDAVAVRILDEADERAAFADAVRLPFGLDALLLQLRERCREVVDADGNVAVAGAEVVGAAVVVEGQLEHRLLVADAEEVVRRLELSVSDDLHVALEAEAERLVEPTALLGVSDPHHRVQKLGHDRILELRRPSGRAIGLTRNQPLVENRFFRFRRVEVDDVLELEGELCRDVLL